MAYGLMPWVLSHRFLQTYCTSTQKTALQSSLRKFKRPPCEVYASSKGDYTQLPEWLWFGLRPTFQSQL